jgi:RNA polymerase sigma-70 factor (ECF subfamily)
MIQDDVLQNTFVKNLPESKEFPKESKLFFRGCIVLQQRTSFLNQKLKKSGISSQITRQRLDNLRADVYFGGNEIQLKLQQATLHSPEKTATRFKMKYF